MNETTHPNQSSITLASLLFLTHFTAGATAVFLYTLIHNLEPIARVMFALAGGGAMGLLLTMPLQRAIRALDWALLHLLTSLPVAPLPTRNALAGLMVKVNLLADRERPLAEQRQSQLQQAEEAAAQQERNRLARDLHDSIKQQLFSIQISAAAAEARLEIDPDGAMVALADVRGSGKAAMVEMNTLLHQLAPAPLEKVGLEQALREQAEALSYRSGSAVTVHIPTLPPAADIPIGGEEAIFRIAQEALSNIARHARATAVSLQLTTTADTLTLAIHDDGQGFDPSAPRNGMGVDNMTRRAEKMGGNLTIESRKGGGCTIQVAIPLERTTELKEQLMYKPDQTLNKIGLIGIGGGLALTAVLIYPLYIYLPSLFIAGWMDGSAALAWLLIAIAPFVAAVTGYLAAKKTGNATRKIGASVGAAAGGTAGLIFYATLGSAAAAVMGSRYLLAHGFAPVDSDAELLYWLTDAVNGTIWWVFVSFFVILAVGALLGAIGGVIAPATPDKDNLPDWRTLSSLYPLIAVGGLLSAAFGLILSVAIFTLLGQQVVGNVAEIEAAGYSLHLPVGGSLFWPLFTPMVIYLVLAGFLFLLPFFGQKKATQIERREFAISAYVGGLTMAGLPIMVFAPSTELSQTLFIVWAGLNTVLTLATLWLARQLLSQLTSIDGTWKRVVDGGVMVVAVLITALSVTGLYGVAGWVWLAAVVAFIFVHSHDFKAESEEKRPFADQIARSLSALVPTGLILIMPIIPFVAASTGLILPIIPSITYLSESTIGAETAVVDVIQQLYSLNWLILFFPIIFSLASLAVTGIFFAIAKFAAKIKN